MTEQWQIYDKLVTDIVNINKSVTLLYSYKPNSYVRLWQNDKLFHKNIFSQDKITRALRGKAEKTFYQID